MDERNFSAKSRVSFGVRVPNSGPLASPDSIVQVGREAESLGYDSIWVHDHLTWTEEIHSTHISSGSEDSNTGGSPDFYEAMTTLAYLAGLVRSVRLGVACLVVPCRNPLLAAKQIASLDVFCNGRLDIGLGIGSPSTLKSREYEVLGPFRFCRSCPRSFPIFPSMSADKTPSSSKQNYPVKFSKFSRYRSKRFHKKADLL